MKRLCLLLLLTHLSFSFPAHAGLGSIFKAIMRVYNINLDIKNIDAESLTQLKSLDKALNGTHHYGSQLYDSKAFNWSSDNWQEILAMTKNNNHGNKGELASIIRKLAEEFPIDNDFSSPNKTENEYYRLRAQTALASRGAAELSYKQAVKQEKVLQGLQKNIDQIHDQKGATDLNNRLLLENTMANIQQTKLLAVIANNAAIDAQEKVNRAREDKAFFTIN